MEKMIVLDNGFGSCQIFGFIHGDKFEIRKVGNFWHIDLNSNNLYCKHFRNKSKNIIRIDIKELV